MVSSLQLTNMTDDHVAYMFVVSGEVEYSSTRAIGIISPRSEWEVDLNMKALDASVLQQENNVILRSTIVSKDLKPNNITLDMFKQTADTIVDEVKLDVVMAAPTLPQLPVHEEFGKLQSNEIADPFKMLDVQPLELHFHFECNKLVPCSVHLTNITDKHVAFRLTDKSRDYRCFVDELPRYGILPPGSIYTLIVTTKKLEEQPQKRDYDLILQSCVLGDKHVLPFENQSECNQFFTQVKELGGLVREVALKAISAPQEKLSELARPGIKISSVENTHGTLGSLDTNPILKWIMTGYSSGNVRIENYETQELVSAFKVSKQAVDVVKFIQRKGWVVAGTSDGYLHVYDYETKLPIKSSWKACGGSITSLAVHPTEPYVLSSSTGYGESIKLWNWEEGWEYTQTFKGHSGTVRQLVFNPMDSNVFAGASDDKTVQVWKLGFPFPKYTLEGHSSEVTCLDYFSCGDRQYLISGSDDQTAKIWDLQKKLCVKTLDAFWSPVTCVSGHPNLPVLITGSKDGIIHLWSSSDFSLERVLNIVSSGGVQGIGCLMGSKRVVIGQRGAISEFTMDNMEFHETTVACNELTAGETSCEEKPAPSKLLDVEPLQLRFPLGLGKLMPSSLKLTNKTDEKVLFRLTTAEFEKSWECFLKLPLCGVVQPRSTYTLVVTTKELEKPPQERYFYVVLQSSILGDQNVSPADSHKGYDDFFSEVKELGKAVHEVTIIRAEYGQQGTATSEGRITNGIKILSVEENPQTLKSLDVNQTDPWTVTGHRSGLVRILDNDTQVRVASSRDSGEAVNVVKFIARKKWIVAGSNDGSIYIYNSEKKMQKIERINVRSGGISALSVHPTLPLVLSAGTKYGSPIKLWNWDKQWECTKEFKGYYNAVRQVVFNPIDTNSFTSAADYDHTVKVWNLDVPDSVCTLEGHSNQVNCLEYFTYGSKQYLITGSKDQTAKIWDLETKTCVQTLNAFVSAVTAVCSHPSLPLLITGSDDGVVHFWSSATFRLEKTLNFGFGRVVGIGCFEHSRRIVIGQDDRLSVIEVDEEPVATKGQDDGEEPVATKGQDDDEEPVASKGQDNDEEPVGSKDQDDDEEHIASKDQGEDEEPGGSKDQDDDEEHVASKDQGEDEEPVGSKDQDDDEETVASKDQDAGEEPVGSKDHEEPVACKDQEHHGEHAATKKKMKRTNNARQKRRSRLVFNFRRRKCFISVRGLSFHQKWLISVGKALTSIGYGRQKCSGFM